MNSVALLTARAAQDQLAAATRHAQRTGGQVWVVPSAQPPAPGPFDFAKSAALADVAYQRTVAWLENEIGGTSRGSQPVRTETDISPPTPAVCGRYQPPQ